MTTQPVAVKVVQSYRRHMHGISEAAGKRAAHEWTRAKGDREAWLAGAAVVSLAARRASAAATSAMHGLLLGSHPKVNLESIALAQKPVWAQPIDRYDTDLRKGMLVAAALAAGALRAASAAATDVTSAAGQTAIAIDQTEERITGYGRCLSARACVWCAEVAGQDYQSADTADAVRHNNCSCTVIPIIGDVNPARAINAPLHDLPDSAYVTDAGEAADRPDEPAD